MSPDIQKQFDFQVPSIVLKPTEYLMVWIQSLGPVEQHIVSYHVIDLVKVEEKKNTDPAYRLLHQFLFEKTTCEDKVSMLNSDLKLHGLPFLINMFLPKTFRNFVEPSICTCFEGTFGAQNNQQYLEIDMDVK